MVITDGIRVQSKRLDIQSTFNGSTEICYYADISLCTKYSMPHCELISQI